MQTSYTVKSTKKIYLKIVNSQNGCLATLKRVKFTYTLMKTCNCPVTNLEIGKLTISIKYLNALSKMSQLLTVYLLCCVNKIFNNFLRAKVNEYKCRCLLLISRKQIICLSSFCILNDFIKIKTLF